MGKIEPTDALYIVSSGKSVKTTAPAPTIESSPIVTLSLIVAFVPIKQCFPTVILPESAALGAKYVNAPIWVSWLIYTALLIKTPFSIIVSGSIIEPLQIMQFSPILAEGEIIQYKRDAVGPVFLTYPIEKFLKTFFIFFQLFGYLFFFRVHL